MRLPLTAYMAPLAGTGNGCGWSASVARLEPMRFLEGGLSRICPTRFPMKPVLPSCAVSPKCCAASTESA